MAKTRKSVKKEQQKKRRKLQRRKERLAVRPEPAPDLMAEQPASGADDKGTPPKRPRAAPPKPAEPPHEKTPMDYWWEDYEADDGEGRLRMTREKLQTVQPDEPWYEAVFPEAVDELQGELTGEQYAAFLEEVEQTRPDVFALGATWYVRSMAFEYVASDRLDDLDRVIGRLAQAMKEVDDPFFSLMSLIRLAGRTEAAKQLIDAAMALLDESGLTGWAQEEIIAWAMFAPYQECVRVGATDEAIAAVCQYSIDVGLNVSEQARDNQRRFALHLAGKSGKTWTRQELRSGGEQKASRKMYLVLTDFMRWLCESQGFIPLVADELRRILTEIIFEMEGQPNDVLGGLKRSVFEPALAKKFGFMSLDSLHAPAAVVAMRRFYDFLTENEFVDDRTYEDSIAVCDQLWTALRQTMKEDWRGCRFLEHYWPETARAETVE